MLKATVAVVGVLAICVTSILVGGWIGDLLLKSGVNGALSSVIALSAMTGLAFVGSFTFAGMVISEPEASGWIHISGRAAKGPQTGFEVEEVTGTGYSVQVKIGHKTDDAFWLRLTISEHKLREWLKVAKKKEC